MNKLLFVTSLFLFVTIGKTMAQTNPEHIIPVEKNLSKEFKKSLYDKTRYTYSDEKLKTIGMPCGGIAAGQLYVRGDGSLASWWIANNAYNTGYGIDHLTNFKTALGPWEVCYQTFEPRSFIDQYFELTVEGEKFPKTTKRLNKSGFNAIEFIGEYPIAQINYRDKNAEMPIDVSMEVFSPFIPMDAKSSATPGTILKFKLKNTSKKSVKASLNGVLQNMVMRDLKGKNSGESRNTTFKKENLSGVVFDFVPADDKAVMHPYNGNMTLALIHQEAVLDANNSNSALDTEAKQTQTTDGNKLNGSVATTTIELKAGESTEVVFLLTWYFPNRPME